MKVALFVVLLLSVAFAQFVAPPVKEIMNNNSMRAAFLESYYQNASAKSSAVLLSIGSYVVNLQVNASVDIAGLSLMVDNMTYPTPGLSLLIARGERQEHLMALPSEGFPDFSCDRVFFEHMTGETAWRCDFEPDYCAEFENRTYAIYDLNATFQFKNLSTTVPATSTSVPVPQTVLDEMADSSGRDVLNVTVAGNVIFVYEINDRVYSAGDCVSNYVEFNGSVPLSVTRSFVVGGTSKLFFLKSPVLREQWFRNNHFDFILLSQSPLYHAEFYLNGNLSKNFTLRNFTVVTDQYGLQQIISNKTEGGGGWSEAVTLNTPSLLETENHSFVFVYQFNNTYEGLGRNNLSFIVNDSFTGSMRHDEVILSRTLSYGGNTTEAGTEINETTSRKSVGFITESLSSLHVSLGLMALLFILIFVNSWFNK